MLGRVTGNLFWGLVSEVSSKGALFLTTVYLAGILGADYFGRFAVVQTIFIFMWMGVDLGITMYATREVARSPQHGGTLLVDLTLMRAAIAVVLAAAIIVVALLAGADPDVLMLVAGFSVYLIIRAVQPDWLLRGREQYRQLAIINLCVAIILLVATWLSVRTADDFALASLPWILSYTGGAIGCFIALSDTGIDAIRSYRGTRWSVWRQHWSESVHFTLSSGVSTIYQNLPLLFVFYVGGAAAAGLFAAPFRLIVAVLFVISVFPMTVYPVVTNLYWNAETRRLKRLILWVSSAITAATAVVCAIIWRFGDWIVSGLFGQEYLPGVIAIPPLLAFLLLRSVRAIFVRVVCGAGQQRRYTAVSAFALFLLTGISAVLALTSLNVLISVALGLAITEAAVLCIMLVLTIRVVSESSRSSTLKSRQTLRP